MFTIFEKLPYEIQLKIFQLAHVPRVIEISYKNGQLCSNQPPPALMHVCHASRDVVLRACKPWLPQFAGTIAHQPWEMMAKKKTGDAGLSKLQNVYIDMEMDTLLLNSQLLQKRQTRPQGMFGDIERMMLRNMAVEMEGWVDFMQVEKVTRQCGGLETLNFFESQHLTGQISIDRMRIQDGIKRLTTKRLRKNELPNKKPTIFSKRIKSSSPRIGDIKINNWYRYKYPKGYQTPKKSSRLAERSQVSEQELVLEPEDLKEASVVELGVPRSSTTAKQKTTRYNASQSSNEESAKTSPSSRPSKHNSKTAAASRLPATRRARKLNTPPASTPTREERHPGLSTPQKAVWTVSPKPFNHSYFEVGALSPSPEPESAPSPEPPNFPAHLPARPQTPVPPQHDPFHEWTELNWEPLLQPSSPADQFTIPPIENLIETPAPPKQAAYIDPWAVWGVVEADQWDSKEDTDNMARKRKSEQVDEEVEERLLQFQLQADAAGEDEEEAGFSNADAQGPLTPEPDGAENTGVPARIRAERQVRNEVQLLIQWKNYPEEKDWTWEVESELKQDVPNFVKAWRTTRKNKKKQTEHVLEDEVEKILGKKKRKGQNHYLVKWVGYEEIDDRTWEPCERLKVDVPDIVEDFEEKEKKKLKARK